MRVFVWDVPAAVCCARVSLWYERMIVEEGASLGCNPGTEGVGYL